MSMDSTFLVMYGMCPDRHDYCQQQSPGYGYLPFGRAKSRTLWAAY
jgi:hypothetical protein